jgi:hypothetical protein
MVAHHATTRGTTQAGRVGATARTEPPHVVLTAHVEPTAHIEPIAHIEPTAQTEPRTK